MFLKTELVISFLLLILMGCHQNQQEQRRPLVKVTEIMQYLEDDKQIQVIDVRSEAEFEEGHIPGAHQIWRNNMEDRESEIRGMRISREGLSETLGKMGIHAHDSIYLYDAKGNVDAARLWWLLRLYGFQKVALIDGGFIQWRMQSLPIERGMYESVPTMFVFPEEIDESLLAVKNDVVEEKFGTIIDARSKEEYDGILLKNGALRGGHIPGAIHLDYMSMIQGGAFTLCNKSHLQALLKERNIDVDEHVAVYCHSGVRSAFETFVFTEILGMENVSNYDGSWVEWSADESLPAEAINY